MVALFVPALLLAALALFALERRPDLDPASAHVASSAAHHLERDLEKHRRGPERAHRHLDPRTTTGIALLAALVLVVGGGLVVGALAYLTRAHVGLQDIDDSVAPWGASHTTAFAHDVVELVTSLASTAVLTTILVVVVVVEMVRRPNRWLPLFVVVVSIGQSLVTNSIKDLLDRVRPTIDPAAHTLGPSFPSGHSASAAACFAAIALLLGRGRTRRVQHLLAAGAVFVAVAVATSRVLLGVHWLSDVIGGLALGWAWFALCSVAFGGRLLRFGTPVEAAERVLVAHAGVPSDSRESPSTLDEQ